MPQRLDDITTIFIILLFMVSLFPNAFHFIWSLPISYIFLSSPLPKDPIVTMSWFQKQITLPAKARGSYLITDQIVSALPEIQDYKVGLLNLFVQHTSCALSLNENCAFPPLSSSLPNTLAFSTQCGCVQSLTSWTLRGRGC